MRTIFASVGLVLNFAGIIMLLHYKKKAAGAVTQAYKDQLLRRRWDHYGYICIAVSYIVLMICNSIS